MFNLGSSELLLILLVALIVVGPKDLPKVARTLGKWIRQLKKMLNDFKEETGLDDTVKELKDATRDVNTVLREADPRKDLKEVVDETDQAVREAKTALQESGQAVKDLKKELTDELK